MKKMMVIAIDTSVLMEKKKLEDKSHLTVAKSLVKIIIRTLLLGDRVSRHLIIITQMIIHLSANGQGSRTASRIGHGGSGLDVTKNSKWRHVTNEIFY